ncbi:MAG: glucose-6-phosphate isomerase [Herminiimonas sp.]|nr:glucose-6-phosphate isomerase [Herminiimonas sp.]
MSLPASPPHPACTVQSAACALSASPAFAALQSHHATAADWSMCALFDQDPTRFEHCSLEAAGLFLDYSKNRIMDETVALLCALARERGVEERRTRMFAGDKINTTEQRAVLHTALRAPGTPPIMVDGQDVTVDVHAVLARIRAFSDRVRSGQWTGTRGKALTTVVNIGIGGSFLGPKMVCQALRANCHPSLTFHFVSNIDSNELDALLPRIDPDTTLFIVASKTFGTAETIMNAHAARAWLVEHCGADAPARHFVAVSTNRAAVTAFGIDADNMFPFWDWVGGRYSVWSAVGLPLALAIGADGFAEFLAGAHAMDAHFRSAPLAQNMPVILALLGVWYRNFFDCRTLSIAPYWQDLQYLPAYLQQLDMESNGKQVDLGGRPVKVATAPVLWGDVGTNGQHAYFQLLHQGCEVVPVDFITVLHADTTRPAHHTALLANCFAQSAALMRGKTEAEARTELAAQGLDAGAIDALAPHRSFPGNRPSNTILLPAMTPHALGALIALYEHKVFVQGVIWGINSFDQWGVELGKALAKGVESALQGNVEATDATGDASTRGLIARARSAR